MEIRSLIGHDHTVNGLSFSPNGLYLASSSADGTARIWDVLTGKEVFISPKSSEYVTSVSFSPDSKLIAFGGYSDSAYICAFPSGKLIKQIPVNTDKGSGYGINLSFSGDRKWLAVGEDNKTASLYRTSDWMLVYTFKPTEALCGSCGTYIKFSPNNKSF